MRARQSEASRTTGTEIRLGQGRQSIDDAVSYSLSHRTRVEIRAILNDGKRSRTELARLTNQPPSRAGWHITKLLSDGTIEHGQPKRVGSATRYYYRAAEVPSHSDEEMVAMPAEARKGLVGVALQASLSEALAAFWADRMVPDPHAVLAWSWFNVDVRGRNAIANEQAQSLATMQKIAAKAFGRVVELGAPSTSIVVASLGYARARFSPSPPLVVLDPIERAREVAIRLGRGKRGVEEAVSYAIRDKLRVEILIILNDGERNRYELADMTGETPKKIKHHLKELLDEGSIEIAHEERVGNVTQNYYRTVTMPSYSVEEYAALPPESRQAIAGVVLQTLVAEALAAYRAWTMVDDPLLRIACRGFDVDAQGRVELCDEQVRSWERMYEIEAEALNRVAKSGEPTRSIMVNSLGFVRSRRPSLGGASPDTNGYALGGFDLGSPAQPARERSVS